MVFETIAYADSAIKPTSLLDHTKGWSKVCCGCQFHHSTIDLDRTDAGLKLHGAVVVEFLVRQSF